MVIGFALRDLKFQSTLPVRGATIGICRKGPDSRISIHAPREGSDAYRLDVPAHGLLFQSTLPVRGATVMLRLSITSRRFQSTLPVRGATMLFHS